MFLIPICQGSCFYLGIALAITVTLIVLLPLLLRVDSHHIHQLLDGDELLVDVLSLDVVLLGLALLPVMVGLLGRVFLARLLVFYSLVEELLQRLLVYKSSQKIPLICGLLAFFLFSSSNIQGERTTGLLGWVNRTDK